MNKMIILSLAASIVASIAFGTAVRAEGEYYTGASKARTVAVDSISTGSISGKSSSADRQAVAIDSGDYFKGANRPN
jgi:hypothetical protein